MKVNRRTVKIEWGDCDPAGIVFFPRYFAYFDASTMALFESVGLRKQEFLKQYDIAGFAMVDTRARFIIPSRFGDEVVIESTITEFRRSSFDVHHRLLRGEELAVEGFETRVWVGYSPDEPGKLKSVPVPEDVVERFA